LHEKDDVDKMDGKTFISFVLIFFMKIGRLNFLKQMSKSRNLSDQGRKYDYVIGVYKEEAKRMLVL